MLAAVALGAPTAAAAGPIDPPRVEELASAPGPSFSISVEGTIDLPAGTRLAAAVQFADRVVHATWQTVDVGPRGAFAIDFKLDRPGRHGVYAVVVVFDPARQPLDRARALAGATAQRWQLPVYVGSPRVELTRLEEERRLLADTMIALAQMAEDLLVLRDPAARRDPRAPPIDEDELRARLAAADERLVPLSEAKLLLPYFPAAVEDARTLITLLRSAIGGEEGAPRKGDLDWVEPLTPAQVRDEIVRRRDEHAARGLLGRPGEDADPLLELERAIAFAAGVVAEETAYHAHTAEKAASRAGGAGLDRHRVAVVLRRGALLAEELDRRVGQVREIAARAHAGDVDRLVRLAGVHARVQAGHAAALRVALDIPAAGGEAPAKGDALAALEAERTALLEALARSLEERRAAARARLGERLAELRALRARRGALRPGRDLDAWRRQIADGLAKLDAVAETDPLARLGAVRWQRLYLQTLGRRDRLTADATEDARLLDAVLDRLERRLAGLVDAR